MKRLLVPLVALLLGGGGLITPTPAFAGDGGQRPLLEILDKVASAPAPEAALAPAPAPALAEEFAFVLAEEPAPAPAEEPASALAPASVNTSASSLGGEISLAEAQASVPSTLPFQPNDSLFGGEGTNVRLYGEYQGVPGQAHSRVSTTLAPQGKPFLVQVTGEQTTGDCPSGPGGSCEYDSRRLDVYGAYRFWTPTTEGNIGPFVRFQDNQSNGTWRSPDGLYSGSWESDYTQPDIGIRGRLRHSLNPNSAANPWIGAGGEYDFANGGYDAFGEGGIRPGNPKNPWNLYAQGGVDTDGGYFYPEITTPNPIGDTNSKFQVQLQLQAKGVLYGLGRGNSNSRLELGAPITLNFSPQAAIQVVPAYVLGLDSNTKSGFGASVQLRFGF